MRDARAVGPLTIDMDFKGAYLLPLVNLLVPG